MAQTRNERLSNVLHGTKWYLTGPMTGIPQFNYPAFTAAAAFLREQLGAVIISPAEQDAPDVQAAALASGSGALIGGKIGGETWGDLLAKDVKLIADDPDLKGLIFLPGWEKSRGSRLEGYVAILCKKVFRLYPSMEVVGPNYVLARL